MTAREATKLKNGDFLPEPYIRQYLSLQRRLGPASEALERATAEANAVRGGLQALGSFLVEEGILPDGSSLSQDGRVTLPPGSQP